MLPTFVANSALAHSTLPLGLSFRFKARLFYRLDPVEAAKRALEVRAYHSSTSGPLYCTKANILIFCFQGLHDIHRAVTSRCLQEYMSESEMCWPSNGHAALVWCNVFCESNYLRCGYCARNTFQAATCKLVKNLPSGQANIVSQAKRSKATSVKRPSLKRPASRPAAKSKIEREADTGARQESKHDSPPQVNNRTALWRQSLLTSHRQLLLICIRATTFFTLSCSWAFAEEDNYILCFISFLKVLHNRHMRRMLQACQLWTSVATLHDKIANIKLLSFLLPSFLKSADNSPAGLPSVHSCAPKLVSCLLLVILFSRQVASRHYTLY